MLVAPTSERIVGRVTGRKFSQLSSIRRGRALTLVNGGETFSHPVTAAAKLDPQPAVSGDDWLWQLVAAEATWVAGQKYKLRSDHHDNSNNLNPPHAHRDESCEN